MKTSTKLDLRDLTDVMEHLLKSLPNMTRAERIDVAARLKPAAKHIATIDEAVKAEIKKVRDGKEGYVNGEVFRAKLSIVPTHRFDQKALREADPDTYDVYYKGVEDERVSYEAR